MNIADFDPVLWAAMLEEEQRQEDHIGLIASENYASPRVMEAQGTKLTNKYAEGYSGKRYYGGCEFVDKAEDLAIERAKALFGAAYAKSWKNAMLCSMVKLLTGLSKGKLCTLICATLHNRWHKLVLTIWLAILTG